MRINLLIILPVFLLIGCATDTVVTSEPSPTEITAFADGFETMTEDFSMLFPGDGSRWTNLQLVAPASGSNEIDLTRETASEGAQSLRIFSRGGMSPLSKADVEKAGFVAAAGQRVIIEVDLRIDADANLADLFLLDFECCSCWDPTVPDNQCPGVRLKMGGANDFLSIERGKIGGSTLTQSTVGFPRFTWNQLRWEMVLSPDEDGVNILALNGTEILRENGMNLPNAQLFAELGAANNIDFTLQEPVAYERLQVGATANPTDNDLVIFVDNVRVRVEE